MREALDGSVSFSFSPPVVYGGDQISSPGLLTSNHLSFRSDKNGVESNGPWAKRIIKKETYFDNEKGIIISFFTYKVILSNITQNCFKCLTLCFLDQKSLI